MDFIHLQISSTEFIEPTPEKILGVTPLPEKNSWVRHCYRQMTGVCFGNKEQMRIMHSLVLL
jgi:hypothetical protein